MTGGLFTGPLAPFADTFTPRPPPGGAPADDLLVPARLAERIGRMQACMGGDWQPVCSLWSQFYFNALIIPAVTLVAGRAAPAGLGLQDLSVAYCATRGCALSFGCRHAELPYASAAPDVAFASLLHHHVAVLIDALAGVSGLSRRLFWENAGRVLAWTSRQCVHEHPASRAVLLHVVACTPEPPGARQALGSQRAAVLGHLPSGRRSCCLRDRVPGLCRCQDVCPRATSAANSPPAR